MKFVRQVATQQRQEGSYHVRAGLVSCVIAAMVATSCGGATGDTSTTSVIVGPTATSGLDLPEGLVAAVDGVPISADDVEAQSIDGATPNELAETLRRLIINRILEASVAALGIEITAEDESVARTRIIEEAISVSGAPLEEILVSSGLNETGFDLIVRQSALADAVEQYLGANAPPPRDEDVQELYDAQILDLANVCTSHILVETASEAQAAIDRTLAGEEFADLARELSTGPSGPGGGDIGCSAPSSYVAPYAAATLDGNIGTPYGPVETQFGFHVIMVTDRTVPTLDEMRDVLAAELVTDVFPVWLSAEIAAADVVVDPEYGAWTVDPSPYVLPPQ